MHIQSDVLRWLEWLGNTMPAVRMRESVWSYPAVETLHILAFTVLVGAAAMFDLRLLGVSTRLSVVALERHLLRSARWATVFVVPTGALLFLSHPVEMAANPFFQWKLVLIALATLNAIAFHWRTFKGITAWDAMATPPLQAKLAAVLSLTLWASVISCGRLIAYY